MSKDVDVAKQNEKGAGRLSLGAWIGLAAGVLTIVVPLGLVLVGAYAPSGTLSIASPLLEASGTLVAVGAILYLISLFVYRRAFAALRAVDAQFWFASILCLVGSVGLLLIIVGAAVVDGTAGSLVSCAHGQPSHILSCLESSQPLGAYTALAGFVLAWIGGFGIVLGLSLASTHFDRRAIGAGGAIYLLFLLALLVPLVELAVRLPGVEYYLIALPILAVLAPILVLSGARAAPRSAGAPA